MRSHPRVVFSCLLAAASLLAPAAGAVEIPDVGGEPMAIDITNTAVVGYHFDNRNDDNYAARYLDDDYGEWLDRLNVQVSWWRLQLGVRFDAATYFATPSVADADIQELIDAGTFGADSARRELNTRYLSTYYPAKLWLGYTQPGLDVTVGDFYAQLGRGLVFSARKLDELAIDTTVRGGKIVAGHDFGPFRIGATAFAGQMNPLRVDEASGRRLHGDGSPLFFGFPDKDSVDDLEGIRSDTDPMGNPIPVTQRARPSYLEDTVIGGRIEGGNPSFQLAANASLLLRESYAEEYHRCRAEGRDVQQSPGMRVEGLCAYEFPDFRRTNASRLHDTIRTFSGSVSLPSIAEHGDVYVEVAGQQLRDGYVNEIGDAEEDLSGYAVYAAVNARGGPVAVSLEGKHYRSFVTLSANIDTDPLSGAGFNAPEFDVVAYSQPPTAEPIYAEPIGAPNVCVTGGRARVDYRFTKSAAVYAWLGHYVSFSEINDQNTTCETSDELRTNTWDMAAGTELEFERAKSHARAWAGARHTEAATFLDFIEGEVFYSEGYVRYDLVKHLAGPFSLQMQGNVRRRYRPENFQNAWLEGENYTALQWSPHISAIFGFEYSTQLGCAPGQDKCPYFNGGLQWKTSGHDTVLEQIFDTVSLFLGQRRGGLRCVSGVCRFFPPFEGARLDIVSRF